MTKTLEVIFFTLFIFLTPHHLIAQNQNEPPSQTSGTPVLKQRCNILEGETEKNRVGTLCGEKTLITLDHVIHLYDSWENSQKRGAFHIALNAMMEKVLKVELKTNHIKISYGNLEKLKPIDELSERVNKIGKNLCNRDGNAVCDPDDPSYNPKNPQMSACYGKVGLDFFYGSVTHLIYDEIQMRAYELYVEKIDTEASHDELEKQVTDVVMSKCRDEIKSACKIRMYSGRCLREEGQKCYEKILPDFLKDYLSKTFPQDGSVKDPIITSQSGSETLIIPCAGSNTATCPAGLKKCTDFYKEVEDSVRTKIKVFIDSLYNGIQPDPDSTTEEPLQNSGLSKLPFSNENQSLPIFIFFGFLFPFRRKKKSTAKKNYKPLKFIFNLLFLINFAFYVSSCKCKINGEAIDDANMQAEIEVIIDEYTEREVAAWEMCCTVNSDSGTVDWNESGGDGDGWEPTFSCETDKFRTNKDDSGCVAAGAGGLFAGAGAGYHVGGLAGAGIGSLAGGQILLGWGIGMLVGIVLGAIGGSIGAYLGCVYGALMEPWESYMCIDEYTDKESFEDFSRQRLVDWVNGEDNCSYTEEEIPEETSEASADSSGTSSEDSAERAAESIGAAEELEDDDTDVASSGDLASPEEALGATAATKGIESLFDEDDDENANLSLDTAPGSTTSSSGGGGDGGGGSLSGGDVSTAPATESTEETQEDESALDDESTESEYSKSSGTSRSRGKDKKGPMGSLAGFFGGKQKGASGKLGAKNLTFGKDKKQGGKVMMSEDPLDYFSYLPIGANLFINIEKRYRTKHRSWALEKAKEKLKK